MSNSDTKLNMKYLAAAGFFAIAPSVNAVVSLNAIPHVPLAGALLVAGGAVVFAALALHQGLIALSENDYPRAKLAIGFVIVVMLAEFSAQWLFAWTHGDRTFAQDLVMAVVYSFLSLGASICIALETWRAWAAASVEAGFRSRNRAQAPRELRTQEPEVAKIFDQIARRNPKWTQRLITQEAFKIHDAGGKPVKAETGWIDELPSEAPALPPVKKAKPPKITATVADLPEDDEDTNVTNLDALKVATAINDTWRESHNGKDIPRSELITEMRAELGKCSTDLAAEMLRQIKSTRTAETA